MAFDLFTKEELDIAYKITKVALYILVITGVVTSFIRLGLVYVSDGQAGLMRFIEGKTDSGAMLGTQENLKETLDVQKITTQAPKPVLNELPQYIEAPTLGISAAIQTPDTKSVAVMDNALSKGPVYYEGSGTPGNRNMFIFGHSSGLPVIHNKAYKVFNTIKNAKVGEYIYIRTSSGTHTYSVRKVEKMSKYSTWVKFDSEKPILTLSTCDSFGKASDRWVLEADYVGFKSN